MAGVVYTKSWVVRLMLDLVGYVETADLAGGVAIEPSCGCGAFLEEMTKRLASSAKSRGKFSRDGIAGSIRAYDIDVNSAGKSRETVERVLAGEGMDAADASYVAASWVNAADTLLTDMPKADWVVGNPPYVRSSLVDRDKRAEYARRLDCVTMGTDLYVGFYEVGLKSLKETGRLCYICSDRWLQNRYGSRLRSMVSEGYSVDTLIRLHGADVFEDEVSAYPAITILDRSRSDCCYIDCEDSFSASDAQEVLRCVSGQAVSSSAFDHARITRPPSGSVYPLASTERLQLVSSLTEAMPSIESSDIEIGIGIASGCDDVFITTDEGIVENDRLLPIFHMRDYRNHIEQVRYLVNPWDEAGNLVDLERYPKLERYFSRHARELRARHVARKKPADWYRTLDKPNRALLGKPMLLFPDMSAQSDPVLSDGTRYPHHNCYWLMSKTWDLEALGGLLMSDVVEAFIDAYGVKMRGRTLRFQAQYLRMVHIPEYESIPSSVIRDLADAFAKKDRRAASEAAHKAYGLRSVAQ